MVLPTDVPATIHETKEDFISISLDAAGNVQMDKERITTKEQFIDELKKTFAKNPEQKILISAGQKRAQWRCDDGAGADSLVGFSKSRF